MRGAPAATRRRSANTSKGLEPPVYGPRQVGRPSKLAPYLEYLRERLSAFPDLSAVRLTREIRERGYKGAYTAVKRFLAAIRPESEPKPYELRFETPPGYQAQVDFARFVTTFTDEPGLTRVVIQIEGSSYRLRQHADLVPEHVRSKAHITPPPAPKRRGRPPGKQTDDQTTG